VFQAFWLVPLTGQSGSREIASGRIEEMESRYTRYRRWAVFLDPSTSESMGYCGRNVAHAGLESEKHFRTINVQWIGQWALWHFLESITYVCCEHPD